MSQLRMLPSSENLPDRSLPPLIDGPTGAPGPAYPQNMPSPTPDAPAPTPPVPSVPYPPTSTIPPIVSAYPMSIFKARPWLLPVGGTALGFLAGLLVGYSMGRKRRSTF
jgi:hypothetical protein